MKKQWCEICTTEEIREFMERMDCFHDSCIKEMAYVSGAYVNEDLSMYPLNDKRILRVTVQRQSGHDPVIELEFEGITSLVLHPVDLTYTCEITRSFLYRREGDICWSSRQEGEEGRAEFDICGRTLRWRSVENELGPALSWTE